MKFLKVKGQKFKIEDILVLRKCLDADEIILIDNKNKHSLKYNSKIETSLIFFRIWKILKKYSFNKDGINIYNLNHIANDLHTKEETCNI